MYVEMDGMNKVKTVRMWMYW